MGKLQRLGGMAAIAEALIYVGVFIFYGTATAFPKDGAPAHILAYLGQQYVGLALVNLIGYVLFGVLLAVLVSALHERLKNAAPALMQLASTFGLVWVGLVIASGMLANIGLGAVLKAAASQPEQALQLWRTINTIVEGLGGGNEVVGGLWVLLLSCAALKGDALPRAPSYLGVLVGIAGIATIYPSNTLTEIFGVSQIVWFFWIGICMVRHTPRPLHVIADNSNLHRVAHD